MGHKQWPSCQVTDSSLSFVGLSSARTGPCRQRRTAAKAVPAPARSIRPLGHAKTVLNIGHFGACLAIFHSVCQKGTGGKCLNIRKHRVSLNGRFAITGAATCRLAAFFCFLDLFVSCRPEAIDDSALASAAARCAQCTACSLLVARSVQGLALKTCAGGEVHITACVHDDASADVTCTI